MNSQKRVQAFIPQKDRRNTKLRDLYGALNRRTRLIDLRSLNLRSTFFMINYGPSFVESSLGLFFPQFIYIKIWPFHNIQKGFSSSLMTFR